MDNTQLNIETDIYNKMITVNLNENRCSICLQEIQNECITNCNHNFCKECLDTWFDNGKNTCPLCRKIIQYFNNNEQNNRIIIIKQNRNTNRNRNRNTTNNQSNTLTTGINCYAIITTIVILILYIIMMDLNNEINYLENEISINKTNINTTIDDLVDIGVIHNNLIQLCYFPKYYVNKCFNFL